MSSPEKALRRAARACDACKRRKVRCDGQTRCLQCERHDLCCIYAGPGHGRGRSRIGAAERGALIAECRSGIHDGSPGSPGAGPAVRIDPEFFYSLIPQYMDRVYPLSPIITEAELRGYIQHMHTSSEAAMLVYAFAAEVISMTQIFLPPAGEQRAQVVDMVDRALRHWQPMGVSSAPTIPRIITCLFLELTMGCMRKNSMAIYYLREATTLLQILLLETPFSSDTLDSQERARRERIYWHCFIHERYGALAKSMPMICLNPLPSLPQTDLADLSAEEQGFNYIIKTFILVDRDFVELWTGDRSRVTTEWVQRKHNELVDDGWHLGVEMLPTTQQADLIITRQWLRTLTWQLAISNFLMSSDDASSEALSLAMPIRLSSQLRHFLERMSLQDVAIHGWGFVEKLFEITNTIADVLMHLAPARDPNETRRRIEDVLFAKSFLFDLPVENPILKDMLEEKLAAIEGRYGDHYKSLLLEHGF